jgi:hypothetical protein
VGAAIRQQRHACPSHPDKYVDTAEHATCGCEYVGMEVIMWSDFLGSYMHRLQFDD